MVVLSEVCGGDDSKACSSFTEGASMGDAALDEMTAGG